MIHDPYLRPSRFMDSLGSQRTFVIGVVLLRECSLPTPSNFVEERAMALLYEKSRLWRALVHATRDPKILALCTVVATGGCTAIAFGLQSLTDQYSEKTAEEMREKVKKDRESRRYADHSKRALDIVLKNAVGEEATPHKYPMKLPGVHWHPAVDDKAKSGMERTQRAKAASDDGTTRSVT